MVLVIAKAINTAHLAGAPTPLAWDKLTDGAQNWQMERAKAAIEFYRARDWRCAMTAVIVVCGFCDEPLGKLVRGLRAAICEQCLIDACAAYIEAQSRIEPNKPNAGVVAQVAGSRATAMAKGYTGDMCDVCQQFTMRRSGTCLTCDLCGAAGGCG